MYRLALTLILVVGPALAQQSLAPPPPEILAASRMLQEAQQREFALSVEVAQAAKVIADLQQAKKLSTQKAAEDSTSIAQLRAENEKLRTAQSKPDALGKP